MEQSIKDQKKLSKIQRVAFLVLLLPFWYILVAILIIIGGIWIEVLMDEYLELPPGWEQTLVSSVLYVMLATYLLYAGWAWHTPHLSKQEKVKWIACMFFLNIFGMFRFHQMMHRRYRGREGQIRPREAQRFDRFLVKYGLRKQHLTDGQHQVLMAYVRRQYEVIWGLVPVLLLMGCLGAFACWGIPRFSHHLSQEWLPTEVVVMDSNHQILQENRLDEPTKRLFVDYLLMMGAALGVFGGIAVFFISMHVDFLFTNFHRRMFLRFLKAGGIEQEFPHKVEKTSQE